MLSQLVLTKEERAVNPQLGYPLGYAKLCRREAVQLRQGSPTTPFGEGPPQRFLPYSPQPEEFAMLEEWDSVFPVAAETDRDPPNAHQFAEELWQQLDHLGNAGFDPAKFRVDSYGNVVYWNADPSSPLAWEIDHWFPHPRGGRTVATNLRVVQWQAYQRKKNRLEFLVPWWDLQHGCSINQFLSAFASKNADFRKRSFALFFAGGEDESVAREHVGECRPWPQQFREKKAQCGLAAAAIVSVPTENKEAIFRSWNPAKGPVISNECSVSGEDRSPPRLTGTGTPTSRHWSPEEEEALRRAVKKFGPGSWKEIKEFEPALANCSTVQIKDKLRSMRGESQTSRKENAVTAPTANGRTDHLHRQSAATTALQRELRVKIRREEDRREKEEEIAELEETVTDLKRQNEKERLKALELEAILAKQKQHAEKQRRWAETQSSYRMCLERIIRDTIHQTISYKEQARLSQAACSALMARLDCQKATCEAAEKELLQRYSQREILEAAMGGELDDRASVATPGWNVVNVSSCVNGNEEHDDEQKVAPAGNDLTDDDETTDEVFNLRRERRQTELLHQQQAARKSLDKQVIKVTKQVEYTREAVEPSSLMIPADAEAECPCGVNASVGVTEIAKCAHESAALQEQLDAHTGNPESEGESDFAEDEMGHELCESEDTCQVDTMEFGTRRTGPGGIRSIGLDLDAMLAGYEYVQSPVPEPADDPPVPSAREARPDFRQEVQKNVIMVQAESSKADVLSLEFIDSAALYKQEYLDELLQQVRFQIPNMEAAEEPMEGGRLRNSEDHLDELLQQVLTTHLDRIRSHEAATQQGCDADDETLRQMGKSNLDKWLQVLLFKDAESGGSSPGQDSPLHRAFSPALSQISMAAAVRESLEHDVAWDQELGKNAGDYSERPKSLWGGLLRKRSTWHVSEQPSFSTKLVDEECDAEEAQGPQRRPTSHDGEGVADDTGSSSLNIPPLGGKAANSVEEAAATAAAEAGPAATIWKAEVRDEDGPPVVGYAPPDPPFVLERRYFPRPLSDVDELSETESLSSSCNTAPADFQTLESKDPNNRSGLRASFKAAGLVWKKAVKKKG